MFWLRLSSLAGVVCCSLGLSQVAAANAKEPVPSVMSINLCADQLVMLLADPPQIKALSRLSRDGAGSYYHELAASYPTVEASAEQILPHAPDVVLTGPYVSRYTRTLLADLGLRVESLEVATSLDGMLANITLVGDILQRVDKAASVVAAIQARLAEVEQRVELLDAAMVAAGKQRPKAAVYDANGYTVGLDSIRGQAMSIAGWHNVAEDRGIESYGALALEDLIHLNPDALIESPYSAGTYSRGQMLTRHPALRQAGLNPFTLSLASNETICAGPWSVGIIEQLVNAREALR